MQSAWLIAKQLMHIDCSCLALHLLSEWDCLLLNERPVNACPAGVQKHGEEHPIKQERRIIEQLVQEGKLTVHPTGRSALSTATDSWQP